ncbi:HutD/Ves family protein [Aquabacterium sp. OR-4]|uniref:HutD/Ves family protein n=1 Tax=Aquabacterium sp. OR-4 TaxID=2978127 RepID=UPI0028C84390|nr:HutD family protein [Aquabacterium sp. OR-4]MDT7839014.1 HutD family protein [Aquabacterium sp. OR-4]
MSEDLGLQWQAAEAVAAEPWRNGGGSTRTLWVWPAGAAAADWRLRISLADITRDGPFSPFAGVRRWFAVVQGAGVNLAWPQQAQALTPCSPPICFDGAQAPGCSLIGGATRDLNLMLRGVAGGLVKARPDEAWQAPPGAWRACFCTGAGHLQTGHDGLALPGMGLVLPAAAGTPPDQQPWQWTPASAEARAWWLWADLGATAQAPA